MSNTQALDNIYLALIIVGIPFAIYIYVIRKMK